MFWDVLKIFSEKTSLRIEKERLQLALLGASLGTWEWNIKTGKAIFDENWCRMIGYEPEELVPDKSTWESFLHPEDKPEVFQALEDHFQKGTVYDVQFRMKTKTGAWKWISAKGKVIEKDLNGAPLRMIGIHEDIDEQKYHEKRIKEEKDFSASIIETAPFIVLVLDSEGNVIKFNRFMEQLTGYTLEEVRGKSWFDFFIPDQDKDKILRLFRENFQSESCRGVVNPIRTKDGGLKTIEWFNCLQRDDNGHPVKSISIGIDISERIKSHRELVLFKTLVKQTNDEIYMIDFESGRLVSINDKILQETGYSREELNNLPVWEFQTKFPDAQGWDHFKEEVRTRGQKIFEGFHKRKDGSIYPIEVSMKYFKYEGKDFLLSVARNIEKRKKTERQLHENIELFTNIFHKSPLGKAILDKNGVVLDFNRKTAEIFGIKDPSLVRNKYNLLDDSRFSPGIKEKALNGETVWNEREIVFDEYSDLEFLKPEGQGRKYLKYVISPIFSSGEKTVKYLFVQVEDITHEKIMQKEKDATLKDLRDFKDLTIDREHKMIELKKEINLLSRELGRKEPYDVSF